MVGALEMLFWRHKDPCWSEGSHAARLQWKLLYSRHTAKYFTRVAFGLAVI